MTVAACGVFFPNEMGARRQRGFRRALADLVDAGRIEAATVIVRSRVSAKGTKWKGSTGTLREK